MESIKEVVAREQKRCPWTSRGCTGAACMAWVADVGQRSFVEIDWPENIDRPRVPGAVEAALSLDLVPGTPQAMAVWIKEKATEALSALVGQMHESRQVVAAAPADFKLTKVRLSLKAEPAGHCSLIR